MLTPTIDAVACFANSRAALPLDVKIDVAFAFGCAFIIAIASSSDATGQMDVMDRYGQQAIDMLVGRRAQEAFDLTRETDRNRDRYGPHLWCQQALLARQLPRFIANVFQVVERDVRRGRQQCAQS